MISGEATAAAAVVAVVMVMMVVVMVVEAVHVRVEVVLHEGFRPGMIVINKDNG